MYTAPRFVFARANIASEGSRQRSAKNPRLSSSRLAAASSPTFRFYGRRPFLCGGNIRSNIAAINGRGIMYRPNNDRNKLTSCFMRHKPTACRWASPATAAPGDACRKNFVNFIPVVLPSRSRPEATRRVYVFWFFFFLLFFTPRANRDEVSRN